MGDCCQSILAHLDCIKHNEISVHFCRAQKYLNNRIWYEYQNLFTGSLKRIRIYWKWLKVYLMLSYAVLKQIQFKKHCTMHKNL